MAFQVDEDALINTHHPLEMDGCIGRGDYKLNIDEIAYILCDNKSNNVSFGMMNFPILVNVTAIMPDKEDSVLLLTTVMLKLSARQQRIIESCGSKPLKQCKYVLPDGQETWLPPSFISLTFYNKEETVVCREVCVNTNHIRKMIVDGTILVVFNEEKKLKLQLNPDHVVNILYLFMETWKLMSPFLATDRMLEVEYGSKSVRMNSEAEVWRMNGLLHREEDKPAIIDKSLGQEWYRHGKLHRDGDEPAVISKEWSKWYKDGELHRDGDNPAIIMVDGSKEWYQYGKLHRDNDMPAVVWNIWEEWYQHGKRHREGDRPAVITAKGDKKWYNEGNLHRGNDNPAIVRENGSKVWYRNGYRHRDGDKPALIDANGLQEWFQYGRLHRDDGKPACISTRELEWWENGKFITRKIREYI